MEGAGCRTHSKLLIGLLAVLALPSLSACNTARGMGEDVEAAGKAMSGTAQDVEDKVTGEPRSRKAPPGTTSTEHDNDDEVRRG